MKICIVSDSHDRSELLAAAVAEARDGGAEAVIHCGDVIGGNTLRAALKLDLPMHVINGNNIGDPVAMSRLASQRHGQLIYHGPDASIRLHERRVFVTHYPHLGHGMACSGDFDLVCCGHSHVAEIREQANVKGAYSWLVNPGSVAGLGTTAATWILGDLAAMRFEIRTLPQG